MTVSSTTSKAEFLGDGVLLSFAYTYRMDSDSDMKVYLDDTLQPSGYTVNRAGDNIGGSVVFDIAPLLDVVVTLLRVIDETQETDYTPYDAFPAEAHEDALDKLTMLVQQQQEQIDRNGQAIGEIGVTTEMPPFSADKGIKWDDGTDKKLINTTFDPDEQATLAAASATDASNSAIASDASAVNSQLEAWNAEAEAMTADSYATEPHNILVKSYTSNGDGTFTPADTADFSSFHWSVEAAGAGGVPDAPNDASPYVRQSLTWVVGVTKTAYDTAIALLAPLASPLFTGVPKAPTPADNSEPTALATTQFVIDNAGGGSFTALDDTPADYAGQAGKVTKVNVAEDGLEFGDAGGSFTALTDTPADYAGQAGSVVTVNVAEDALEFTNNTIEAQPIGSFINYGGTTAPAGYLACLGQEVTQAQYPDLFAAIGNNWNNTAGAPNPAAGNFRLPPQNVDGLGLYLRGDGDSTVVGEYQADVFKEHTHDLGANFNAATTGSGSRIRDAGSDTSGIVRATGDPTETRPRSITTLLCIKATFSSFTGTMGGIPANSIDSTKTIGATNTFTTNDGKTVTVADGLVTVIV